jgi:hypothetical protein
MTIAIETRVEKTTLVGRSNRRPNAYRLAGFFADWR